MFIIPRSSLAVIADERVLIAEISEIGRDISRIGEIIQIEKRDHSYALFRFEQEVRDIDNDIVCWLYSSAINGKMWELRILND